MIRGDMAPFRIGSHCMVDEGSVLLPSWCRVVHDEQMPPHDSDRCPEIEGEPVGLDGEPTTIVHIPTRIGDHVHIGKGCVVSAHAIGNFCRIGDGAVISRGCVLHYGAQVSAVAYSRCTYPISMWSPVRCHPFPCGVLSSGLLMPLSHPQDVPVPTPCLISTLI